MGKGSPTPVSVIQRRLDETVEGSQLRVTVLVLEESARRKRDIGDASLSGK